MDALDWLCGMPMTVRGVTGIVVGYSRLSGTSLMSLSLLDPITHDISTIVVDEVAPDDGDWT